MAAPGSAEWFDRGRAHQQAGRLVDAMLCFQRAVKTQPTAAGPRLHLGEVLREIGLVREAVDVWREAAAIAADDFALLVGLAEASLAVDDPATARDAAARVLLQDPGNARARLLQAVAGWQLDGPSHRVAHAEVIMAALERDPRLLAIAEPAARVLDATPGAHAGEALHSMLARVPQILGSAPASLLALAATHAATVPGDGASAALFARAAAREYAAGEHDALRRIALAATRANAASAADLRRRYVALCAAEFASATPLPWPRRTDGARLRIVVLVGEAEDPAAATAVAAIAALPPTADSTITSEISRSAGVAESASHSSASNETRRFSSLRRPGRSCL